MSVVAYRAFWITNAPQTDQQVAERIHGDGFHVNWPWDVGANHDPGDEDRSE